LNEQVSGQVQTAVEVLPGTRTSSRDAGMHLSFHLQRHTGTPRLTGMTRFRDEKRRAI